MRQQHKSTTLPIGTISSGTLRLEDLIPALASELDRLRLTRSERTIVNKALTHEVIDEDDDSAYLYDELTTIAENHCPDYAYFGSTDGDGAEIGVWPLIDSLEEDSRRTIRTPYQSDVVKINAGDAMPNDANYVMSVSDHGNVTLYRRSGRRWVEVWSVA